MGAKSEYILFGADGTSAPLMSLLEVPASLAAIKTETVQIMDVNRAGQMLLRWTRSPIQTIHLVISPTY